MRTYTHNRIWGLAAAAMLFLAGCGSAAPTGEEVSSAESSDTRTITGTLPGTGSATGKGVGIVGQCSADTVVATDLEGNSVEGTVDQDCRFVMHVRHGHGHRLFFLRNGTIIAVLHFRPQIGGFSNQILVVIAGVGAIDLGRITFTDAIAMCERDPNEQLDRDGDGIPDSSDTDDDGDGIADVDEIDCDLDGLLDDLDDAVVCEAIDAALAARVILAKPWDGRENVDLEQKVKAWVSCQLDPTSATAETFRVAADDGSDTVTCEFAVPGHGHGHKVECRHRDDPFLPDHRYTATIEGLRCLDGRIVKTRQWSWTTEAEADDDDGCAEDTLDEEGVQ